MVIVLVLLALIVGSVLFSFWSPWWFTPIASNWGEIDDALIITFVISGIVFVALMLFMAYAIFRYRNRGVGSATFEPENKRLEWLLVGVTTVGIVAMLAPGLKAWFKFINVPEEASAVEAIGQQWLWTFRFPGPDGEFGTVATQSIYEAPFGLDPNDPRGADDILIEDTELHLPVGRPIRVNLRSVDVLHDFYVPQFRAKMDLVPGMVTYFWFTPTVAGTYEILCAEYCGTAHSDMRGTVVIEPQEDFDAWLAAQPTFAELWARAGGATRLTDAGGAIEAQPKSEAAR